MRYFEFLMIGSYGGGDSAFTAGQQWLCGFDSVVIYDRFYCLLKQYLSRQRPILRSQTVVMPRHTTHRTQVRHPDIVHTNDWSLIMLLIFTVEQNHDNLFAMQIKLLDSYSFFSLYYGFCSSHVTLQRSYKHFFKFSRVFLMDLEKQISLRFH